MNNHERAQELISRMLDEELAPDEEEALALHLKECPDCAAVYAAFSAVSGMLEADLEEAPESLRENVMAQIRREETRKQHQRRNRWIPYVSIAAVLALVLLAGPRLRANRADLRTEAAGIYSPAAVSNAEAPAAAYEEAFDSAMADEEAPLRSAETEAAAAPVYDLGDSISAAELIALLGGVGEPVEEPDAADLLCTVLTADRQLDLYFDGVGFVCVIEGEGAFAADWDTQAVADFVQNGEIFREIS